MKRILLCGPMPPPIGGVSIHLQRLLEALLDSSEFCVEVVNESRIVNSNYISIRKLEFVKYLRAVVGADLVHLHSSVLLFLFLHAFVCVLLRKRFIVTLHSFRAESRVVKFFVKKVSQLSNLTIVVSAEIDEKMGGGNLIVPAFIPPQKSQPLPHFLKSIISEKKKLGSYMFCANAFRLVEHEGDCLYGLDLCIDLASKLKKEGVSFFFVYIVIDSEYCIDKFNYYKWKLEELCLEDCFLLLGEPVDFNSLLMKCDCFIRPTNTDGDALSVREALEAKVSVVASDVVNRPKGVNLFKNRSSTSLKNVIYEAVIQKGKLSPLNGNDENVTSSNALYSLLDIYRSK